MTKRSFKKFKRNERDFYETPKEACEPLWRYLRTLNDYPRVFADPCAGYMAIHRNLRSLSNGSVGCGFACDINPDSPRTVQQKDALDLTRQDVLGCHAIITNPPWSRGTLHPMIERFSDLLDTFLLFDADWVHTKQSVPYLPRLRTVISVGRVKWIADSSGVGFDNCCWYRFGKPMVGNVIELVGRTD